MSSSNEGFGWVFGGVFGLLAAGLVIYGLCFAGGRVVTTCSVCHGSGSCNVCRGSGKGVFWGECAACGGKKNCPACGGTGLVLKK